MTFLWNRHILINVRIVTVPWISLLKSQPMKNKTQFYFYLKISVIQRLSNNWNLLYFVHNYLYINTMSVIKEFNGVNAFAIQCNEFCFLLRVECEVFPTGWCSWMYGPQMVMLFGMLSESLWYRAELADAKIINRLHFHPKFSFCFFVCFLFFNNFIELCIFLCSIS